MRPQVDHDHVLVPSVQINTKTLNDYERDSVSVPWTVPSVGPVSAELSCDHKRSGHLGLSSSL